MLKIGEERRGEEMKTKAHVELRIVIL